MWVNNKTHFGFFDVKKPNDDNIKISEIVDRSGKSNTLINEYRNRLIENGLIYSAQYGCVSFVLPFFDKSINRFKLF